MAKVYFKKEALAQVFSCEFYEISMNTFFYRAPLVAASDCFMNIFLIFFKDSLCR